MRMISARLSVRIRSVAVKGFLFLESLLFLEKLKLDSFSCLTLDMCYDEIMKKENVRTNKRAQEIQDEIFRKMSADRKIKLSSELTSFCLKLNSLNGNNKPRKTSYQDS